MSKNWPDTVDAVPNFFWLAIGPRGSGKSYLFESLLLDAHWLAEYDKVVICSPSIRYNSDYKTATRLAKQLGLDLTRITDNIPEHIEALIAEQGRVKEECKLNNDAAELDPRIPKKFPPRILLILDDGGDSGAINFRGIMDVVAMRCRHLDMSSAVLIQRSKGSSVATRDNADMVFFWRPFTVGDCEKFLEEYVSKDHRKALREKMREIYRNDHDFIIVDNHDSLERKLKYSTADAFVKGQCQVIRFENAENEESDSMESNIANKSLY